MSDSLAVRCPTCGTKFRAAAKYAGKKVKCPAEACEAAIRLPESGAPSRASSKQPSAKQSSAKPKTRTTRPAPLAPLPGGPVGAPRAAARPKKKAKKASSGGGMSTMAVVGLVAGVVVLVGGGFAATQFGGEPAPEPIVEAAPVAAPVPTEPEPSEFVSLVKPYFETHCTDCHGIDSPEGDLDLLSDLEADDAVERITLNRSRWEHVFEMIRVGAMPPADMPTPEAAEQDAIVAWLDDNLFHIDCEASPTPGRVTARRLNRTEYNNTVRDLFGVNVTPADDFPSDEVGYGFDNIGDVQSAPPLLIEKYLDAAEEVSKAVVLTGNPEREVESRSGDQLRAEEGASKSGGFVVIGSNGNRAAWRDVNFKRDGEYLIRVLANGDKLDDELPHIVVRLGDEIIGEYDIEANRNDIGRFERRLNVKKGRRPVTVTFTNDGYRPKGKNAGDRNARVAAIEMEGPFGVGKGLKAQAKRFIVHRPGKGGDGKTRDVLTAARDNLRPFAWRAFRRPVEEPELNELAKFAQATVEMGGTFEEAMQATIQVMLVSPKFLYRVEPDDGSLGRVPRPLDDWELASRLSYFLWNTMPDDELFEHARENRLRKPEILEAQVNRMLADPRATEMLENFAGQWLGLRTLPEQSIDAGTFPKFNPVLLKDMAEETERLVQHVARENRPVLELLTADYTFVNGRLAKHYGIKDVEGDSFLKVSLSQIEGSGKRRGLLTHGSILALTSYPNRTSPVRRGEWILTNILGDEPPPPPPNVPALDESQAANPDAPLRQQLEQHRADPNCAACHRTMDELGFGFENFDATGRYREKDGKHAVDASGVLPSGQSFDGAIELVSILDGRREDFTETFVQRLLTFALGRNVDYRDQCIVDAIIDRTKAGNHRFQGIIRQIVLSDAFRRQGPDPEVYAMR